MVGDLDLGVRYQNEDIVGYRPGERAWETAEESGWEL